MSASSRPLTRARPSSLTSARERGAGRGLVVEGREHQALVARLDQQAGEHRDARADREAAGSPGDGIGEHVAVDAELHVVVPSVGSGRSGASGGEPHARTSGVSILPCGPRRGRAGPCPGGSSPGGGPGRCSTGDRSSVEVVGVIAAVETVDELTFVAGQRADSLCTGAVDERGDGIRRRRVDRRAVGRGCRRPAVHRPSADDVVRRRTHTFVHSDRGVAVSDRRVRPGGPAS